MITRYQHYRQHIFLRKGSEQPITDGAVLFEAADWKQFQDSETSTSLTIKDLETLGYNREMTIDAIRAHTEELLSSAKLPFLIEWCRHYVEKIVQKKHLCLIPEQPMGAARSAIQKILEFCDDVPKKEEVKPKKSTIFNKISDAFWQFILKRISKS